jgi:hypothetical protein
MANKVKIPRTPKPVPPPEEPIEIQVKRVLHSKTIWVNLIAIVGFFLQRQYGFVLSEDLQIQLLSIINIILRFWTKEPIAWGGVTTVSGETSGNTQENS